MPAAASSLGHTSGAGQGTKGRVMLSQNSRSLSTRAPGGLPAIMAQLKEPIDMPATQSGEHDFEHRQALAATNRKRNQHYPTIENISVFGVVTNHVGRM